MKISIKLNYFFIFFFFSSIVVVSRYNYMIKKILEFVKKKLMFTAFWREEKLRKYMFIQKRIQQKRTSSVLGGVLVWVPRT